MPEKISSRKKLTHEEERNLDLEISFLEGVLRRDPDYVEALQILGEDYTARGRYAAGLGLDERLCQMRPDDPAAHYNLACSYSLTGKFHQALAALDRALALGYRDFKWLARDPDLLELRMHPLYTNFRAKLRRLKAGEL